ncbi:MAG: hypothetical protein AB7J13_03060 [Pyrinomonadaceae bacterium]
MFINSETRRLKFVAILLAKLIGSMASNIPGLRDIKLSFLALTALDQQDSRVQAGANGLTDSRAH